MKKSLIMPALKHQRQEGFTIVELVVGIVIFGIIVVGLTDAYNVIRLSYSQARQVNEIYTVLSACPEVDRALEFNSISNTGNCYPNNSFPAENGLSGTVTYSPTLTVTSTSALSGTDPLQGIPDSKVVDISVGYQNPFKSLPNIELKMLITRNGIGQT